MATVLAVTHVFNAVVATFAADAAAQDPPATPVPNVFGWREPAKRGVSLRVVWVPGDDRSGNLGELAAASAPGRNPRPLGTLHELFTVYCEAYDASAPEDEHAQYVAARLLFDAWYRAVYKAAHGRFTLEATSWVTDKKERRFGATIRTLLSIEAMLPDEPAELAPVNVAAAIAVTELDITEVVRTTPSTWAATTGAIALAGEQPIDGVDVLVGQRVLVKDQADGEENGIYVAAAGAWSRAADFDEASEVLTAVPVRVVTGVENGGAEFVLTTPSPIVVGTTPLTFERVEAA